MTANTLNNGLIDFRIEHFSFVGFSLQNSQCSVDTRSGPVGRAMIMRQIVQTICNSYDFADFHSSFCSKFRHALGVSRTILPFMMFPYACEYEHIIKSISI